MPDFTGVKMGNSSDGILLIDKHEDETSYGVVRKVKSAFGKSKTPKVGHAGTLDPFASGLLIILVGQGTKLSSFIMSEKKVYQATVRLGVETDTLDPTGQVVKTSKVPDIQQAYIAKKAQTFVGEIEQKPPVFSAIRYKGTRAYKLARKGVEINLKRRKVTVFSFRIISIDLPDIAIEVTCSSGTYIRSLAYDLGRELGTGAHLKSLRRMSSGSFEAYSALSSKEIPGEGNDSSLHKEIIPLRDALPGMGEIEVNGILTGKVRNGYRPRWEEIAGNSRLADCADDYVKLVSRNELVAIIKANNSGGIGHGKVRIERVFS
jgi:tRNA pseudouridine55 synthase